jgi:hypothetical protein
LHSAFLGLPDVDADRPFAGVAFHKMRRPGLTYVQHATASVSTTHANKKRRNGADRSVHRMPNFRLGNLIDDFDVDYIAVYNRNLLILPVRQGVIIYCRLLSIVAGIAGVNWVRIIVGD